MARSNNSLPAFLLALRAWVVTKGVATDSCCQICDEEQTLTYAQGDVMVMLIPGDLVPEDQGGEGQNETIYSGSITFRLICLNIVDVATSSVTAMTSATGPVGIYTLFQSLLSAVRFWDQCDSSGNNYLTQALRMGVLTKPARHPSHKQYIMADCDVDFKICIGLGGSGT